jgi:hypothetical protein
MQRSEDHEALGGGIAPPKPLDEEAVAALLGNITNFLTDPTLLLCPLIL